MGTLHNNEASFFPFKYLLVLSRQNLRKVFNLAFLGLPKSKLILYKVLNYRMSYIFCMETLEMRLYCKQIFKFVFLRFLIKCLLSGK